MFKPNQFAANDNPKAEHLWPVQNQLRDPWQNGKYCSAFSILPLGKDCPSSQALGSESQWAEGTTSLFMLSSCIVPPGLLTLKPRMRAHRPLGKVTIQVRTVPLGAASGKGCCRKLGGAGFLLWSCYNLWVATLQGVILPLLHACSGQRCYWHIP